METKEVEKLLAEYRRLPSFSDLEEMTVNSVGIGGELPISVAAARNDCEAITLLLDNGACIDARGESGYTALHEAVEQGSVEALDLLLRRGANKELLNDDGLTPLDLAVSIDSPLTGRLAG